MRYCIDPGHGGSDPGATFKNRRDGTEYQEKDIVLDVANRLRVRLQLRGHQVFMTRQMDVYKGLRYRTDLAKKVDADALISIHCNADPDPDGENMPEARGGEIWYAKDEDRQLAEFLAVGIERVFPKEPFRGLKNIPRLFIPREARMPAALVEIAFLDHSESARRLSHPLERDEVALALDLGLLRWEQLRVQGEVFE